MHGVRWMFIGHFALGVATKKIAPTLPIWILLLAPQFMDLMFMPLVALGIEGYELGLMVMIHLMLFIPTLWSVRRSSRRSHIGSGTNSGETATAD